jgi:hypothetical protein
VPEAEELSPPEAPVIGSMPQNFNWIGATLSAVSVMLFLIGALLYWNNARQGKSIVPKRGSLRSSVNSSAAKTRAADNEEEISPDTQKANTSTAAISPKSVEDLKVSQIVLAKAKGGNLVYALGTLRNESDVQRFGVRLELDLLDSAGKKIGTSKDYARLIEPRKEWRFRALVLAPNSVSARVASIKEQE